MILSPTERQRAREQYDLACQVVSDLNHGRRRWLMSIPARPDDDPDLLICRALESVPRLLEALEEAEAEIAALRSVAGPFVDDAELAEDRADYFASLGGGRKEGGA